MEEMKGRMKRGRGGEVRGALEEMDKSETEDRELIKGRKTGLTLL